MSAQQFWVFVVPHTIIGGILVAAVVHWVLERGRETAEDKRVRRETDALYRMQKAREKGRAP